MSIRVATDTKPASARRRPADPKRAARTRRALQILLVVVTGAMVVDALVGDRGLLAMVRAQHAYADLEADIARLRAENNRLAEDVRRLTHDPAAIEEIARRELGLIRPGEKLFIVKDLPSPAVP